MGDGEIRAAFDLHGHADLSWGLELVHELSGNHTAPHGGAHQGSPRGRSVIQDAVAKLYAARDIPYELPNAKKNAKKRVPYQKPLPRIPTTDANETAQAITTTDTGSQVGSP